MQQTEKPVNQITEGVIWKQLLYFFFPILLGTFFQQLYNTADAMVVGRFVGKEALACVGGSSSQIIIRRIIGDRVMPRMEITTLPIIEKAMAV